MGSSLSAADWNKIWGASVPPRVKLFAWRAAHEVLPTTTGLHRCTREISPSYSFCEDHVPEVAIHTFQDCKLAEVFWAIGDKIFCFDKGRFASIWDWFDESKERRVC